MKTESKGWYSQSSVVGVCQGLSLFIQEKRDWSFDESLRTRTVRKAKVRKPPRELSHRARLLLALLED